MGLGQAEQAQKISAPIRIQSLYRPANSK